MRSATGTTLGAVRRHMSRNRTQPRSVFVSRVSEEERRQGVCADAHLYCLFGDRLLHTYFADLSMLAGALARWRNMQFVPLFFVKDGLLLPCGDVGPRNDALLSEFAEHALPPEPDLPPGPPHRAADAPAGRHI